MDKKRLLAIAGFIALSAALAFALYFVFFRKTPAPVARPLTQRPRTGGGFPTSGENQPRTSTNATEPLPTPELTRGVPTTGAGARSAEQRVRPIVTETIGSPAADRAGGAKFYSQGDGKFYRVDASGAMRPLSDKVFYNVQNVTWSPTADESIIEYPDGANIYYNFDTKKQVTLPKHWEDFSFAPTGDRIAAKSNALAPESRWLVAANPDGQETTLVEPLGENGDKVTVDWSPNKQVVALSRTGDPQGADRQEILFIGLNGENFRSTIVEGRDFRSEWSPEGKKLLYSVYSERNDFKPELWIVNADGDTIGSGRKYLSLNTWADKCAFSGERYVYCGVPQTLGTGAGFAPELSSDTPDTLVKIDLQTGIRSEIKTEEPYVVNDIFVGADGKTLFFSDKRRTGLFSAPL